MHLADVAVMTGLQAVDAVDALLMTGGFPEIVRAWRPGMSRADFLRESVANPLSPLLMAGEYDALTRDVLAVPGAAADTPLVAVSRCGVTDGLPLAAQWGPDDLVRAWLPR